MRKRLYYLFFPRGRDLPFKKVRWTLMVIMQELMMCKYKAVFKYFIKPSYRKDINVLRDILSKAPLKGTKDQLCVGEIHFSHEINYPKWVEKLEFDYLFWRIPYKRIKVFNHNGKWIVIDGNHRLRAMKNTLSCNQKVDVLILQYL